jgi:5-methylcytosine-specific restriction enzyme A
MTEPHRQDFDWERDELILACDLVVRNGWRQLAATDPQVIELSEFLRALPLHPVEQRLAHFRNANGVARKTADIATNRPGYSGTATKGGDPTRRVIAEFLAEPARMQQLAQALRDGAQHGDFTALTVAIEDEDEGVPEGRLLIRRHVAYERNPSLRRRKLQAVLRAGGSLACEACDFDFEQTYGQRGKGFIECHHIVPLHTRPSKVTRLRELALLCANCHRMSHRAPWLTPAELHDLISAPTL